jgi:DNA polymerase-3 subunit gamma/tau
MSSPAMPSPSPRIEVAPPAAPASAPAAAAPTGTIDNDRWLDLVDNSGLRGPARELAAHAAFLGYGDGLMRLSLSPDDDHLRSPALIKALGDALSAQLGGPVQLKFETGRAAHVETLQQRSERQRDARQAEVEAQFMAHPDVQRLIGQHGAKLVPDSIRPHDE